MKTLQILLKVKFHRLLPYTSGNTYMSSTTYLIYFWWKLQGQYLTEKLINDLIMLSLTTFFLRSVLFHKFWKVLDQAGKFICVYSVYQIFRKNDNCKTDITKSFELQLSNYTNFPSHSQHGMVCPTV